MDGRLKMVGSLILSVCLSNLLMSSLMDCKEIVDGDSTTNEVKIADDVENGEEVIKGKITSFDRYKKLFSEQRSFQVNAIKYLQQFGDNMQRHKLVEIMVQQLFATLAKAHLNVTRWGILPGDRFPENETEQESVSKIFENTAMFGDMVLRLPDIVNPLYNKNKDWQLVLASCYGFCKESPLFEGISGRLINLMAQEVNLIPKSPNFINPFKEINAQEQKKFVDDMKKEVKSKKPKKKISRGPRMSHNEL